MLVLMSKDSPLLSAYCALLPQSLLEVLSQCKSSVDMLHAVLNVMTSDAQQNQRVNLFGDVTLLSSVCCYTSALLKHNDN